MNEEFSHNNSIDPSSDGPDSIDAELQVRLMNLVMGEASDFERDQLQSMMEQRPELAAYYEQLGQMHSLLCEVGAGEVGAGDVSQDSEVSKSNDAWQLSADRRTQVLAVLDGKGAKQSDNVTLAKTSEPKRWRLSIAHYATAALAVCVLIGLMLPSVQSSRAFSRRLGSRVFQSKSAPPDIIGGTNEPYFIEDASTPYFRHDRLQAINSEAFDRSSTVINQATAPDGSGRNEIASDFQHPLSNRLNAPGTEEYLFRPIDAVALQGSLDGRESGEGGSAKQVWDKQPPASGESQGLGSGGMGGMGGGMGGGGRGTGGMGSGGMGSGGMPGGMAGGGMGGGGMGGGGMGGGHSMFVPSAARPDFGANASRELFPIQQSDESSPKRHAGRGVVPAKPESNWSDKGDLANTLSAVESPKLGVAEWDAKMDGDRNSGASPSDDQVKSLVDQYNVLIDQSRFSEAEAIAKNVRERQPNSELGKVPFNKAKLQSLKEGGHEDDFGRISNGNQNATDPLMMTVTPRFNITEEKEVSEGYVNSSPAAFPSTERWQELREKREKNSQLSAGQKEGDVAGKPGIAGREEVAFTLDDSFSMYDSRTRETVTNEAVHGWMVKPTPSPEVASSSRGRLDLEGKPAAPIQAVTMDEQSASSEAFSTFSLHVSDVSFKLAQTALAQGQWPDAAKIRIEEFVNALDYRDPLPSGNQKVACQVEQAIHPFLMQRNLLRVSMRTAATGRAQNTPLRLTLLLDNSGSMERPDRRQAVQRAFQTLTQQLSVTDQVALISFASTPRLLADKVPGNQGETLLKLIENLPSEGGTNIEAALMLAREKAAEQQVAGAQNRIVLLTDGAVNLGNANPESLAKLVTQMRDAGIAFDAAGISAQDLNDEVLEALTRQGDGRYYLLDSAETVGETFAAQIAGALRPSAQNVKVQIEFNPKRVGRYKLLGYEKHRLNKEDFRNDQVDAAEMAAAEAGVAVYQFEIKPNGSGDVGSASVRFRDLSTGQMVERRWPIPYESNVARLEHAEPSMQIAASAAMFAAKLGGGALADTVDLAQLQKALVNLPEQFASQPRVQQLRTMIDQAIAIGR